jgi:hypothetical protein
MKLSCSISRDDGFSKTTMASTNKYLAQINKSLLAVSKKCTLDEPAVNGWGFFRRWQRQTNLWHERTNLSPRGPAASKK